MIRVSVIIPVYNGEQYLKKCIESVLNQTYTALDIIIINDGSTDHTTEICREYGKKDQRIRFIDKENGGVTSARKAGLNVASGKYTLFVDADDWIPENAVERLVEIAEEQGADFVSCGFMQVEENSEEEHYASLEAGVYELQGNKSFFEKMFYKGALEEWGIWPTLWGKLFLTEMVRKSITNLDQRIFYGEDAATVFETVLQTRKVVILREALYYYRYMNATSVSGRRNKLLLDNMYYLYEYLYHIFAEHECADILLKQLKNYMISLMNHAGKLLFDIPYNLQQSEWLEIQIGQWQKKYYDFIYARREMWALPLYELETARQIILYGTGDVAKDFKKQLSVLSERELIAWIDSAEPQKEQQKQLHAIITERTYDTVIMAAPTEEVYMEGKKTLTGAGIDEKYIIWKKPVRLELNNIQFWENEGV